MIADRIRHALQTDTAAIVVTSFLLGAGLMAALWGINQIAIMRCNADFALVSPLRRCGLPFTNQKKEYELFQDELKSWITAREQQGGLEHVSVYFRDLDNGPWFGIGEENFFAPASLLKVPIMMAILKEAQTDPSLLDEKTVFSGALPNLQNELDPQHTLTIGQSYSVKELLEKMIIYSDNNSKELLKSWLQDRFPDRDIIAETYENLGIIQTADLDIQLTVKSYSSIFRTLYNASYLSPAMSQYALGLLSQVAFQQGIVAGLPHGIEAAHKFGVLNFLKLKQLHDCGIVYHPKTPYLVCIMTRGEELNALAGVIQEISRRVFHEVDARN